MFVPLLVAIAIDTAPRTAASSPPAPAGSPAAGSTGSPLPDRAVITQTASTNTKGYVITVSATGTATVETGGLTRSVQIPAPLADRLYADLDRAGDLAALPAGSCMKSASFGTRTEIAYRGARSPDLGCAQNAVERDLQADAAAIASPALGQMPQIRRTLPVLRTPGGAI
jgi:hypothetical protein